jgi:hypothetical protein
MGFVCPMRSEILEIYNAEVSDPAPLKLVAQTMLNMFEANALLLNEQLTLALLKGTPIPTPQLNPLPDFLEYYAIIKSNYPNPSTDANFQAVARSYLPIFWYMMTADDIQEVFRNNIEISAEALAEPVLKAFKESLPLMVGILSDEEIETVSQMTFIQLLYYIANLKLD